MNKDLQFFKAVKNKTKAAKILVLKHMPLVALMDLINYGHIKRYFLWPNSLIHALTSNQYHVDTLVFHLNSAKLWAGEMRNFYKSLYLTETISLKETIIISELFRYMPYNLLRYLLKRNLLSWFVYQIVFWAQAKEGGGKNMTSAEKYKDPIINIVNWRLTSEGTQWWQEFYLNSLDFIRSSTNLKNIL